MITIRKIRHTVVERLAPKQRVRFKTRRTITPAWCEAAPAPAPASSFPFDQSNVIPVGTNGTTFEIQIAPGELSGNASGLAFAPYTQIPNGAGTGNPITISSSNLANVVPEPGTYDFSSVSVLHDGAIGRSRSHATRVVSVI